MPNHGLGWLLLRICRGVVVVSQVSWLIGCCFVDAGVGSLLLPKCRAMVGWLLLRKCCGGAVVNWLVVASQKSGLIGRCFYGAWVYWLLLVKCRAVLVGCFFSSAVVALSIAGWLLLRKSRG